MKAETFIEVTNFSITAMLLLQIVLAVIFQQKRKKDHYKWASFWLDFLTINSVMMMLAQLVYFVFHYDEWTELAFLVLLVWLFVQIIGMRERFNFTRMSIVVLEGIKKEVKEVKEKTVQKE